MSYYATPLDLILEGVPAAALSRVSSAEVRQLTAASGKADSYLRGRYSGLLVSQIGDVDYAPATGSTGTGVMTAAQTSGANLPTRAYGVLLQVLSTGSLNTATGKLSQDGGVSYGAAFTLTSTPIVLSWGVTLTLASGTYFIGDVFRLSVSYGALTSHVVALASYGLLKLRGVAPDGNAYDPIRDAYKEALKWFESVRDLRCDPGLTEVTGGTGSDVFELVPEEGDGTELETDRRWQSTMGRGGQSQSWSRGWAS